MEVRITKTRVAMAALFVLAGVGLGSLLSPLVGTAWATIGQIVNISDRSGSANFARVDSNGALKTIGVVALPPQPFSVRRDVTVGTKDIILGPTTATVALTDVAFANYFGNQARRLTLVHASAAAPNAGCTGSARRNVISYGAPSAQTVVQDFTTPIVLKPNASNHAWCLYGDMQAPASDDQNIAARVTVGGYVLGGTFTP